MRGRRTPEAARVAAVAALLAGYSVNETARRVRLPHSTISRIRSEIKEQLDRVGPENRMRIDEMLFQNLQVHIKALGSIAEAMSDPTYLRGQNAADIARLHDSLASFVIRLLEAASAAEVRDREEDECSRSLFNGCSSGETRRKTA